MLMSISSVSGGGKTYSALLLAAGIAGDKGRVAMIDTENGRGEMYSDSPGIRSAFPKGFEYLRIDPPYGPSEYMEAIKAAEAIPEITVAVIDSASHEWEGTGGCCEIAEKFKLKGMPNWAKAKLEHKRFLNHCLSSRLHIIFCLRAREKVKIVKVNGKDEIVPQGLQPICEKNFVFEQLLSLQLEEKTHHAIVLKAPEGLQSIFSEGHLVTKADGDKIRQWNEGGQALDPNEQLQKRARAAADEGEAAYEKFYKSLPAAQKKIIYDTTHTANKAAAVDADRELAEANAIDPAGATPLDDLRVKILALSEGKYDKWLAVMQRHGKKEVYEIKNELEAEDILAELKGVTA